MVEVKKMETAGIGYGNFYSVDSGRGFISDGDRPRRQFLLRRFPGTRAHEDPADRGSVKKKGLPLSVYRVR